MLFLVIVSASHNKQKNQFVLISNDHLLYFRVARWILLWNVLVLLLDLFDVLGDELAIHVISNASFCDC